MDGLLIDFTDFGIARAIADSAHANRTAGIVVGTPAYLAPEQVNGKSVDARTDIYAWGILLYEALTGSPAWPGDSPLAIATARMLAPPPDPRVVRADLSEEIAELVLRMLARDPEDRPSSAREVVDALGAIARPLGTAPRLALPSARPHAVSARQIQRIAVVPLACYDESARPVAFGISELIADAIDGRTGIDLRARGERLMSQAKKDLAIIGTELDVPLVVGGRLEAGIATISLVNARDGLTLWSAAFPEALRDPFGVAYDAVRAIAEALLVPFEPPPAAPPLDSRTVELLLRARYETSLSTSDSSDRVIALLEQAFSSAPTDPWVNAAYAIALARRLSDTEFPGDADEALAMARLGVERAPRLAGTHHALAEVLVDRGDLVGAARSAAMARALAPGSAEVQRLVAHLLIESGAVDAAVTLLRSASRRELAPSRAVWDEARALAARGRWLEADEHLDAAGDIESINACPWLGRVRCALFHQDLKRCNALRMQLSEVLARDKEPIITALDAALGRVPLLAAIDRVESYARGPSCSRQRGDALCKLAVDVAGTAGDTTRMESLLSVLRTRGLVDVTWLDASPTLAGVRASPWFIALRETAHARARRIRSALEGPHETVEGALQ